MHATELEWIRVIQEFGNSALDAIFNFLNYFDRLEFFVLLMPVIWLVFGWKVGLRLFYLLLICKFVNIGLKQFFASPRPFQMDPSVGMIDVNGYGFPSGAAQTSVLLALLLIAYWKNRWRYAIGISYFLVISFSRIYLGVHFVSDIIGGWLVGFSLFVLYYYLDPIVEKKLSKMTPRAILVISQVAPLTLLLLNHELISVVLCGIAMLLGGVLFFIHAKK